MQLKLGVEKIHAGQQDYYTMNICVFPNLCVEALAPNGTVSGDGAFRR